MNLLLILQTTWFGLLAFLITGYLILDGYDLGVGLWYLTARRKEQRDDLLRSIAPFWDGHQVWLIAAAGVSFAAFPPVYAAVFSGLYPLLILLLLCLGARTVAIEYARKEQPPRGRLVWDLAFATGSTGAIVMLGLILGNVLRGLPLNTARELTPGGYGPFNGPALLVTALLLTVLATHGAIWSTLRTSGETRRRARRWGLSSWPAMVTLAAATIAVLTRATPHLAANYVVYPALWAVPALSLMGFAVAGAALAAHRDFLAFAASTVGLGLLLASAAAALFPRLVPALGDASLSLTALNASSSQMSLLSLLVIALLGLPLVFAYTAWVFWIFRGRIPAGDSEY